KVVSYASRKNQFRNRIVEGLRNEDMAVLATALVNCEGTDGSYPEGYIRQVLDQYKMYFDLSTLEWAFTGVINEYNTYEIKIYGFKGDTYNEHIVHIITGDGLVGLEDEWVIPYNCQ
nr:hypothetical protein [Vallitaleaceae bacterium]